MSLSIDSISTRDAFGIALLAAARRDPRIFAIGADTNKSMGLAPMAGEFPERVLNVGIAEQNMALMAAGAAAAGAKAVIATYAPFASLRICEQIRTFICYPGLDVKIISGLGGLSGNIEGVTHQGLEDISVMRAIAGLTVLVPADAAATQVMTAAAMELDGPVYLRLGRAAVETVFDAGYSFTIGKANLMRAGGTDAAVICCGAAVARALHACEILEAEGIGVRLIEMPSIKPLDSQAVLKAAADCGVVVTVEENNIIGGLGGAVCECVAANGVGRVIRVGIDDIYTESAPHEDLMDKYNLAPEHIASVVRGALGR